MHINNIANTNRIKANIRHKEIKCYVNIHNFGNITNKLSIFVPSNNITQKFFPKTHFIADADKISENKLNDIIRSIAKNQAVWTGVNYGRNILKPIAYLVGKYKLNLPFITNREKKEIIIKIDPLSEQLINEISHASAIAPNKESSFVPKLLNLNYDTILMENVKYLCSCYKITNLLHKDSLDYAQYWIFGVNFGQKYQPFRTGSLIN